MRTKTQRSSDRDPAPERRRALSRRSGSRRGREASGTPHDAESAREPSSKPPDPLSGGARSTHRHGPWLAVALAGSILLLVQSIGRAQTGSSQPASLAVALSAEQVARNLLVVLLLILLNGFFAMAETGLLSVRRTRIDQMVEEGSRAARTAAAVLNEPQRLIATLQVVMTFLQLFAAGAMAYTVVGPLSRTIRDAVESGPLYANAGTASFVAVLFLFGMLTLVVGQAARSLAERHADRVSLLVARPVRLTITLAHPFVSLIIGTSGLLVKPFGGTGNFRVGAMSEDELRLLVEQSEEHGVIEQEEKEMIHSIFDFADTSVRQVMTPRLDVTAVQADATVDELIRFVTDSGHSRLPAYEDTLDNIVGVVHIKDVLRQLAEGRHEMPVREFMRPPYFIPDNKRVDDLLSELRGTRMQMAIVRDEYGTITGVVTIEDLLEEIVGDIQDEYDEEEPEVTQIDAQTCVIDGRMSLEDFNERFGLALPMEESDTLGGFVFGLVGHQPATGETAEWDGVRFQIEETDGRRVQKVRVVRPALCGDADNGNGAGHGDEGAVRPLHSATSADHAA